MVGPEREKLSLLKKNRTAFFESHGCKASQRAVGKGGGGDLNREEILNKKDTLRDPALVWKIGQLKRRKKNGQSKGEVKRTGSKNPPGKEKMEFGAGAGLRTETSDKSQG